MSGVTELSSVPHKQPRFWALVTLFLAPAFIFANMYTTQAILPVFSRDFHVSAPTAGLTVSVLVLAGFLSSPVPRTLFAPIWAHTRKWGCTATVLHSSASRRLRTHLSLVDRPSAVPGL